MSGDQPRTDAVGVRHLDPAVAAVAARARALAAEVAAPLHLDIAALRTAEDHHAACDLFRRIWRSEAGSAPVMPGTMIAASHVGCYVTGAWVDDGRTRRLIAASFAFFGADGNLHSHVTGVEDDWQSRGVGMALKAHQWAWCLERGVTQVSWTYDPLIRRNAWFNLGRLGMRAVAYLPDFYGSMPDEVNAGVATDRLYVTWDLTATDVADRLTGRASLPDDDPDLPALLWDDNGRPARATSLPSADRVKVAMPQDIDTLRRTDRDAAIAWQQALHATITDATDAGLHIVSATRDGWYVLERS